MVNAQKIIGTVKEQKVLDICEIFIHTNKENFSYITLDLWYGNNKLEKFSGFFSPDNELFDKIIELVEY